MTRPDGWPGTEAWALRPELAGQMESLLARSAAMMPSGLDDLLSARVRQLTGLSHVQVEVETDAERAVLDLVERFLLDVRSIDDATFAAVQEHYNDDEFRAILFRLALLDGVSKFERLFPGGFDV